MKQQEVMKALVNNITAIVTGKSDANDTPDAELSKASDNYLAFCTPGLKFTPASLKFLTKGLNGATADETRELVKYAAEFSVLANRIPSNHSVTFTSKNAAVDVVYGTVLNSSVVADDELTDEEKAKLKKLADMLTVEKKEVDPVTDAEITVYADSALKKQYNKYKTNYQNAVAKYNNLRIAALTGDNARVLDFTLNGAIYKDQVMQALDEWETAGSRNTYENIAAYIAQKGQKSLSRLKRDLQAKFTSNRITDAVTGISAPPTFAFPSNFVSEPDGWTEFKFDMSSAKSYEKREQSTTTANVGISWSFWKVGADTKKEDSKFNSDFQSEGFSMSFSLTQTAISRPWFSPEFLLNKGWKFAENVHQDLLSNGDFKNPQGQMVAYPTTAIWIKDLKLTMTNVKKLKEELKSTIKAGGSIGWGPFSFGNASHDKTTSEDSWNDESNEGTLNIAGIQLIAFNCFKLPKSPDPVGTIKNWV